MDKQGLVLNGIGKQFYGITVLSDIDFEILPGEIHGLLGENGADDCTRLQEMFPTLDCIMTGRGTLKNPALAREIRGGAPASKEEIRRFHDMMYNEYCEDLSGDRNILFRMKELWSYLAPMFTNNKKYAKKIKKAEKCVVYENAVRELFGCEQLIGEVSYRCS